jgi:serine protease Do
MNNAIVSNTGGYMGLGFAIPSNLLKLVFEELKEHGKVVRGFLGVTLQKVNSDIANAFGLSKVEGALVTDVIQDGPADRAGIKAGDVILKLNKQRIENVGSLRNTIAFMHPGNSAVFLIRRGDKEIEIQAMIASHPENEMNEQEIQNSLGVLVQDLTPELKQQMEYKNDEKGVMIKYVAPNSLAQLAGLRRGQLILSVNRKNIKTASEFYRAIKECPLGTKVLLHVKEGQVTRFVTLRIE